MKINMNIRVRSCIMLVSLMCLFLTTAEGQYVFEDLTKVECSDIKNQQRTGTCWSFATASFLESELRRQGKGPVDLSEMYVVRSIYKDKAMNYVLRQGKANFSKGSLAHDLIRIVKKAGVMPEKDYDGKLNKSDIHDHSEMEAGLKGFLDGVRTRSNLTQNWKPAFENIMDAYMGGLPATFEVDGTSHTPESYAASLDINADDYVSITSFTHHPFYESFILEIPDNYSNGRFYNVPLDELMASIDGALAKGYSISWDGDVSEKGFSSKHGLAILPVKQGKDMFDAPGPEMKVNQENRQINFESYATTDDHLMHIVGTAVDQNGAKYYIIKNSWGPKGPYKGYLYMSESYMRMKTISVLLHQDALSYEVGDDD